MKEKILRYKKIIIYVLCVVLIIAVNIVLPLILKGKKEKLVSTDKAVTHTENDNIKETVNDEQMTWETQKGTEAAKKEEKEEISIELKSLESFMEEKRIKKLRKQILKILPKGVKSVKCLEYQKASPVDMNVVFYLIDDQKNILEANYYFPGATSSVKLTDFKLSDIEQMQNEELKAIQESEKKAKEEAQKRIKEKERKDLEEQLKNQTETETTKEADK